MLEAQAGTQTYHPDVGTLALEAVQEALHGALVTPVERGMDALSWPTLVAPAVLVPRGIRADRGRVHERRDTGVRGGAKHSRSAVDVDRASESAIARWLDPPGQVHDGVGATEERREIVLRDVGPGPFNLPPGLLRRTTGDTQNAV